MKVDPIEPKPSKTLRKREMQELQELGERLVALPDAELARLEALPETLRGAVAEARRITRHEARRRQMQYIGRLMRAIDPEPVRNLLDAVQGRSARARELQHELERCRARMLEDEAAIDAFAAARPGADAERLRVLRRNALREAAGNEPPRSSRQLFRLLREIVDDGREG
ncbi:MAG: hypothetical protein AUK49_00815 [Betaproteobacteria bacterium CG2_30_68_42]|nr:MAG: hypothetical protein AUK49_00815 [Betaproteobacteria bacterium CG2_30_68_42]